MQTILLLCSAALFTAIFALPLLPGLLEIHWPRDERNLPLHRSYSRDPRFFGSSFRKKLAPFLSGSATETSRVSFLRRGKEFALIAPSVRVGENEVHDDVLIARESLVCEDRSRLLDCYAGKTLQLGRDCSARTVLSDGSITLDDRVRIDRWLDAQGTLQTGTDCFLGQSASSSARLSLGARTRFGRAFGLPVCTPSDVEAMTFEPERAATHWIEIAPDSIVQRSHVVRGNLRIGARARFQGSVKAYGELEIGDDVHVVGNVIGRSQIRMGSRVRVDGHVFGESSVTIGREARVGTESAHMSVYAGGELLLSGGVEVFGWLLSDTEGRVTG